MTWRSEQAKTRDAEKWRRGKEANKPTSEEVKKLGRGKKEEEEEEEEEEEDEEDEERRTKNEDQR